MAQVFTDLISDEAIKAAFVEADAVDISILNCFNDIGRRICMRGTGWVPMARVFSALGITPEQLRPIFCQPQANAGVVMALPNWLPFNLPWGRFKECQPPSPINSYEELGYFTPTEDFFLTLAKMLGKKIKVFLDDGQQVHTFKFIAHTNGRIETLSVQDGGFNGIL